LESTIVDFCLSVDECFEDFILPEQNLIFTGCASMNEAARAVASDLYSFSHFLHASAQARTALRPNITASIEQTPSMLRQ
jgi:hypothetical protein